MNYRSYLVGFFCTLVLLQVLSLSAIPAAAQSETVDENRTQYDITHDVQTGETEIQLEARIAKSQEYDDWSLTWNIPENAEITDISTATSESVEIERDGTQITLTEKDGDKRNGETFYINYTTDGSIVQETEQYNISQYKLSLSAFGSAPSAVEISFTNTSTDIANSVRYSNHSLHVKNNSVTADGVGPITVVINKKNDLGAVQTDDFVVYNKEINTRTLNNSYALSTRGTGVIPQYNQVPVIVIDGDTYDDAFGTKSAGRYKEGIIYLSNDQIQEQILPLLTHEYTHAISDRVQYTNHPRWFTEGTAQYTEAIAREEIGRSQNEIDEGYFWDYYSNNESWVLTRWDSQDSRQTTFAYVYSEAIMKQYAIQKSPQAIHQLHENMIRGDIQINTTATPQSLFGQEWEGQVCYTETKSETMECLDETTSYIPPNDEPDSYSTPFGTDNPVTSVEIEETQPTTETNEDTTPSNNDGADTNIDDSQSDESDGLLTIIIEIVISILEWLFDLIRGLVS